MRLLLDSHVLLAEVRKALGLPYNRDVLRYDTGADGIQASAVSLWEIAIKARLGKLDPGVPPAELPSLLATLGRPVLPVTAHHAVAVVWPEPPTRDPFDRMLLAQCAVENLRLVTVDRALVDHPLAWRLS